MQIVSFGDNLHEMLKSVSWKNYEKYNQFVVCLIGPENGKG